MAAEQVHHIQSLLTKLMAEARVDSSLAAEVARAEREFFGANPDALERDPGARFRFQEWYLLDRESEVLGQVPLQHWKMSDADREALTDSLVGVFHVVACTPAEYTIEDLQDDVVHDLDRIEGVEFEKGDVLIGRLFVGSLDTFIASAALCCQREADALVAAFRKDVASLGLDRRLSQAELEHLMFRGRGTGATELPDDIPLERLEADLDACLRRGGAEGYSATAISDALQIVHRPGLVSDPLLEKIAFDTEVDLQEAQRLILQIWNCQQTRSRSPLPAQDVPEPEADATDLGISEDDPVPSERIAPVDAVPETEGRAPTDTPRDDPREESEEETPGLGADIAKRIREGLAQHQDVSEVFAEVERMVGAEPDPDFDPSAIDLNAPSDRSEALAGASDQHGSGPAEDSVVADDTPFEGDLRPLITEYLWETKPEGTDSDVLEQLVLTQCEASVPRMDLETVTSSDLLRLLLQTYLAAAPGSRTVTVGATFGALERFYGWVEETQCYELAATLETVRTGLVDQVARLETASLALSAATSEASEPDSQVGGTDRGLNRVVHVSRDYIDAAPDDADNLVRIDVDPVVSENLREDDLLVGSLLISEGRRGTFAGMVVAIPPIVQDLLG